MRVYRQIFVITEMGDFNPVINRDLKHVLTGVAFVALAVDFYLDFHIPVVGQLWSNDRAVVEL